MKTRALLREWKHPMFAEDIQQPGPRPRVTPSYLPYQHNTQVASLSEIRAKLLS